MAILDDIASVSFRDQTAVITGTTNGLGLAISEELVRRQIATLIMGVRNIQKGEEVKAQLLANPTWHSRNPSVVIHVVELQMRDYESVIAFATEVKVLTQTVDLVLLNAGVGGLDFETTQSGHEKIMQVNVYSNALLVLELLPLLQETAILKSRPSRLTWVGSFVQMDHSLTKRAVPMERRVMDHFDDKSCFDGATRYQDSKLIGTMVVKQLAQRIDKKTVIFNEVSPGPVLTNFGAIYPFYFRAMIAIAGAFASKRKSLAEGVNKYLHAIALVGKESHGAYISNYEIAQRATIVDAPEGIALQNKVFAELMEECKKVDTRLPSL